MINEILSFGYVPAVVLTGYWLISNPLNGILSELRCSGKLGISVTLGIAAWFPILFACSWFNVFFPQWIGLTGWIVSIAIAIRLQIKSSFAQLRPISPIDLTLLAFAIALFVFNGFFVSESILGGRDQGVYATHGAHIAQTGMLKSAPPYEHLYEGENYTIAGATSPNGYTYDIENGDMFIQFPPTFALHLAQFFGIGNYEGMLLFNPTIASVSVLTFFALAALFMPTRWALMATGFFALNVSQVWNARITLSEILAQNIILTGLIIAVLGFRKQSRIAYCTGCLLASACSFARVDGFLLPALIAIANACLFIVSNRSPSQTLAFKQTAIGMLVVSMIAYAFNSITSPVYFGDFNSKVQLLLLVTFSATFILFTRRNATFLKSISAFAESNRSIRSISVILALLAIYAYFIRPYIGPFAEFEDKHYGTRNFRENSLIDLSQYVSIIGTAFALVGACFAIRGICRNTNAAIALLFIPWVGFTLIYLYDPQISTDHIWRIRRFTPLVIPGLIFFASWAIATLVDRLENHRTKTALFAISSLWFAAFTLHSLQPIAFLKQYEGSLDVIREISETIPHGALTLANVSSEILGPLQLAEGHKMIRETRESTIQKPTEIATRILEKEFENGREIFFLSQHPGNRFNILRPIGEWDHNIPVLDRTNTPPATQTHIQRRKLYLSQLVGKLSEISITQSYFEFGSAIAWNIEESGMHGQEYNGPIPFRWSNGDASFTIKTKLTRKPRVMGISWNATKPDGANLKVLFNGVEVHNAPLPASSGTLSIPVEDVPFNTNATNIRIVSDKWNPKKTEDSRVLGIAITSIVLFFDDTIKFGNAHFGNFPVRGINESGLHPVELVSGRSTRWTNGHAQFDFELQEGYSPNTLMVDVEGRIAIERPLTVKWNGQEIYNASLDITRSTIEIPLNTIDRSERNVTLDLITDPIVPAKVGLNADIRSLGARIHGIELKSLP